MTSRIPFLSSVLASEGMYCVVGLKKGAPRQTFVDTLEEIDGVVEGLMAQGYDANADYKRQPHSNENVTTSCEDTHCAHLAPTALGRGNGTSRVDAH